ncbi:hypothetical protein MRX96_057566 [Rhipicephalus microplus]
MVSSFLLVFRLIRKCYFLPTVQGMRLPVFRDTKLPGMPASRGIIALAPPLVRKVKDEKVSCPTVRFAACRERSQLKNKELFIARVCSLGGCFDETCVIKCASRDG